MILVVDRSRRLRIDLSFSFRMLVQDGMKLYQHSTTCSIALQWFLDENPDYWPFIPVKITESKHNPTLSSSTFNIHSFTYANDVPLPPANYYFTYEQKLAIEQFFHEKKYLTTPNVHLDLYQASIIAVCK